MLAAELALLPVCWCLGDNKHNITPAYCSITSEGPTLRSGIKVGIESLLNNNNYNLEVHSKLP